MERKKWITLAVLVAALALPASSGCVATDGGKGVQAIEQMDDLEFGRLQVYITLGSKIAANRLLEEGVVSVEDLDAVALALDLVVEDTLLGDATSLFGPALEQAGLTNDEAMFILLILENELLARGVLDYVDPITGALALSPRTETLLEAVASSIRSATTLTPAEIEQGKSMGL